VNVQKDGDPRFSEISYSLGKVELTETSCLTPNPFYFYFRCTCCSQAGLFVLRCSRRSWTTYVYLSFTSMSFADAMYYVLKVFLML